MVKPIGFYAQDAVVTLRMQQLMLDKKVVREAIWDVFLDDADSRYLFTDLVIGNAKEAKEAKHQLRWVVEAVIANWARSGRFKEVA
jgi:hypothetical protein